MITWMQHNKKYLIVTIWVSVIAFIGAGFVGWGSLDLSNKSTSIAKVGSHDISISSYQSAYQNYFNYFNSLNNGQLTQEMAEQMGLRNIVIQSLIDEALLINFADEMGLIALDSDIANLLTNNPTFHDENGNFNKELYYNILKNNGLKASEYEESLKKRALLDKINNIYSIPVTQKEEELFGAAFLLQDEISLSTLSVSDNEITLNDNETLTYWENNKNSFLTDKEYFFESIFVPVSANELKEEDIKAHYEQIKYLYKDADEKIIEYEIVKPQIENDLRLKNAEKDSLTAYLNFKKGDISAEKNITIKESSMQYNTTEFQTMATGDITRPIKKDNGYEILKLTKIFFPAPKSFEDAKDEVKKTLISIKKTELLNQKAQARVAIFEGKNIGYINKNSGNINGLNNLESSQLIGKIFNSKDKYGYIIANDKAVLYRINNQKLPDTEEIDKNRQLLKQVVEQVRTNEIASNLIKELKKRYTVTQYYTQG